MLLNAIHSQSEVPAVSESTMIVEEDLTGEAVRTVLDAMWRPVHNGDEEIGLLRDYALRYTDATYRDH